MPYRPNTYDRSGELLGAGISSAGRYVGGALETLGENAREDQQREMKAAEERDEYRGMLSFLADVGVPEVTPEFIEKFESSSLGQGRGMIGQLLAVVNRREREQEMNARFAQDAALRQMSHQNSLARSAMAEDRARQRAEDSAEDLAQLAGVYVDQGLLLPDQARAVAGADNPVIQQEMIDTFARRNQVVMDREREWASDPRNQAGPPAPPRPLQPIPGPDGRPSGYYWDENSQRTVEGPSGALFGTQSAADFMRDLVHGN